MSAAAEYTPTTEQVRNNMALGVAFATFCEPAARDIDWPVVGFRPAAKADFDRWLAKHDAEVKAEALREAARELAYDGSDSDFARERDSYRAWINARANQIKESR